ncbi:cytochrome P450 family protein [Streptomyces albipurpureus]|uniref:Cytochrome P450 n=1 Tax=Streptomyces albipurpureus TaxID=2897419 RepID=A0ABT0UR48_9ACTN|nr:cytochrome P450 [Streptomyces sp. CWNU-1]MCM2390826.1 cytochrome P450 [Streptomyces sp. CWNU-1]
MTLDDRTSELLTDPYPVYDKLREAAPVHRIVGPDGLPVWIVTRYEDVREALADPRLSLDKRHATPGGYRGFRLPPALDANMLNMDPPDHTRIRRLVTKTFTARRIERLREPVRRIADELLDAMATRDRTDLVVSYAAPLPIHTICELLGVPREARRDFRDWTDALVLPDPARPQAAKEAVGSLIAYVSTLLEHKRAQPGDDLLSALIAVRDEPGADGSDRLSEDELTSLAFLILFVGYENTVQLIGTSVLTLFRNPRQFAELRENPSRIAAVVDEFMRYEGPALLGIRRFPIEDLTIGGVTVPAGETVMVSLASANRDPNRFPDPDQLDLDRDAQGHVALGHGLHYCLGAHLARLETEIALTALLERFPRLALDTEESALRWRPSIRTRGLLALPVRY